jgi:hypothetical protein
LAIVLIGLNLILLNFVAARHYLRLDWSRGGRFTLSPKSAAILQALDRPVKIVAWMAPPRTLEESLSDEIRDLLQQMRRYSSQIEVQELDVDADPSRAEFFAQKYGVNPLELYEGVLVFRCGKRQKLLPASAMAEYQVTSDGRRIVAYTGEKAMLEALLSVIARDTPTVCFAQGHDERDVHAAQTADYGLIYDEVKRDAYRRRVVYPSDILSRIAECTVLVMGGPRRAYAEPELGAINQYLEQGGRLLVLLGPILEGEAHRYRQVGLEQLLARWGARPMANLIIDPVSLPGEPPFMVWGTREGYSQHPLARSMRGKLTVWPLAREIRPLPISEHPGLSAQWLVRSSAKSWAETDVGSLAGERPLQLDPGDDTPGPISVAVAVSWRQTRLVVFGTEQLVINQRLAGAARRDFNRDLFLGAINWLSGQALKVAIGPKKIAHLHFALEERHLGLLFLICVVGLPLLSAGSGLFLLWLRRR